LHKNFHAVSDFVKEKNAYLEHENISVARLHALDTYRVMPLWVHILLTLALKEEINWSASYLDRFTPGPHWTEGNVRPKTGLDSVEQRRLT
jgi:hypothetical protein